MLKDAIVTGAVLLKAKSQLEFLSHFGYGLRFKHTPSTCQKMTQIVGPYHDSQRVTHDIGALAAPLNLAHINSSFMKRSRKKVQREDKETKREHSLTPQYRPFHHFSTIVELQKDLESSRNFGRRNRSKEEKQQLS